MKTFAILCAVLVAACFGCKESSTGSAPDPHKKVEVHTPNVDVNVNKKENGDTNVDIERRKPAPP
jgi:hypothetical protein